jgi:hypothetical protein
VDVIKFHLFFQTWSLRLRAIKKIAHCYLVRKCQNLDTKSGSLASGHWLLIVLYSLSAACSWGLSSWSSPAIWGGWDPARDNAITRSQLSVLFFFSDRISLCNPGWPWTHNPPDFLHHHTQFLLSIIVLHRLSLRWHPRQMLMSRNSKHVPIAYIYFKGVLWASKGTKVRHKYYKNIPHDCLPHSRRGRKEILVCLPYCYP